jgi:endonuclease YncB( thermonuclease family)
MAEDYAVRVLRVIDGDSVKVRLPDGAEHSVRMYGIDAPEKDQRAGRDSQVYLQRVVKSRRKWRLRVVDVDRYQRLVGVLYPEGGSVRDSANHAIVESGMAYWYREYGGEELGFDDSERYAKRERAGVWGQKGSVRPWDHRRAKRAEQKRRRESAESPWLALIGGIFKLVGVILMALLKASTASSGGRRRRRRRKW